MIDPVGPAGSGQLGRRKKDGLLASMVDTGPKPRFGFVADGGFLGNPVAVRA